MTASLQSLDVGALTLMPKFDPSVTAYTATTTNATNKITATPASDGATVAIRNGSTAVANGGNATWADGENTLTVDVAYGNSAMTYTVRVTKTTA